MSCLRIEKSDSPSWFSPVFSSARCCQCHYQIVGLWFTDLGPSCSGALHLVSRMDYVISMALLLCVPSPVSLFPSSHFLLYSVCVSAPFSCMFCSIQVLHYRLSCSSFSPFLFFPWFPSSVFCPFYFLWSTHMRMSYLTFSHKKYIIKK